MLEFADVQCPYCGEQIDIEVDLSAGDQDYIEDCHVCCRPIEFHLVTDGETFTLDARSETE